MRGRMYKKRTGFYILCILVVAVILALFLPSFARAKSTAKAENNLTESIIGDNVLYRKLQDISRANGTGAALSDETFTSVTELDLTNTSKAPDSDKITDITALRKFDLRSVKVLKLGNNAIETIPANVFQGMESLEYLDVSNNGLNSLDLSYVVNLKVLIANNNNLTKLNLENFVTTGYESGDSLINISANPFDSFADVEMPTVKSDSRLKLIGYNNNFGDIMSISNNGFSYELGLQGLNLDRVQLNQTIKYYNTGDATLSAKIYKLTKGDNNETVETLVKTLSDDPSMPIKNIDLAVGNYRVDYLKNDTVINGTNNDDYIWLESNEFSVVPNSPTYYFTVGNKKYDEIEKLTHKGVLHIVSDDTAEVYYSFGGDEWIKGDEVKLNKGGTYVVKFKSVINGIESNISGVTINASANLHVPDIFMALLVAMLAGVFVVVIYFIGKYLQRR